MGNVCIACLARLSANRFAKSDWPPPKASAQQAIPDKWLRTGPAPTLASVADKFEKSLKLAGYTQQSYYSVPHGFALAAQFEQIRADGTPLPGDDRWKVGPPRVGNLSLLAFIQALAHAPAGIYRAIVFVVTDAPWVQSTAAPSDAQIMAWAASGATSLPTSIGNLPYGDQRRGGVGPHSLHADEDEEGDQGHHYGYARGVRQCLSYLPQVMEEALFLDMYAQHLGQLIQNYHQANPGLEASENRN